MFQDLSRIQCSRTDEDVPGPIKDPVMLEDVPGPIKDPVTTGPIKDPVTRMFQDLSRIQ